MKHSSNFSKRPRSAGPDKSHGPNRPANRPTKSFGRSAFGNQQSDQTTRFSRRPSSVNTRYPIAQSQNPRYAASSYKPSYSKPSIAPTIPKTPKDDGLVRINKFVAEKFAITRREADKFIEDGFVHIESVNPDKKIGSKTMSGKTADGSVKTSRRRHAKVGDRINPKTETVILNQKKVIDHKAKYMYFVYNKPVGIVTHSPTGDELDIKGLLLKQASIAPHITKDLFPIGRLDKKSQGLIILTNDGRMSDLMLNPAYEHEKEYIVTTAQDLPSYFKKSMEKGVNIGDYVTKPCKIELRGPKTFAITITEGKKHQIRRMCEAMKTDVKSLERTRIMNLKLGSLRSNDLRKIEGRELDLFLKQLVH